MSPRPPTRSRAATAAVLAVAAAGTAAGSVWPARPAAPELPIPPTSVPVGDTVASCPPTARLVEGTVADGTDPAFAPDAASAGTALRAVVLGDLAQRTPGAAVADPDGGHAVELSPRLPEDEAEEPAASGADGFSGRSGTVRGGLDAPGPRVLRAQPLGGLKTVAGMTRTYGATDGDLAGQAVSRCQEPSNDQWLVGASTEIGRTALLVVTNPSESPATVDLELFGPDGPIEAANTRGIVIAPGDTHSVVLAGLAPDLPAVSVHVRSTGAPVSSVIQQSVLRGLTPGGVEWIEPSAAPSATQVVPGVSLMGSTTTRRAIARPDGFEDASAQLQVTVPGTGDARLTVRAFGEDGEVDLPDGGTATAAGGATTRIPLDSLPEGEYTFVVQSDRPATAAARFVRGNSGGRPVDLAMAASADRLGGQHLVVLPEDAQARLLFGTTGSEAHIELRPVSAEGTIGSAREVTVSGGTTEVLAAGDLGRTTVALIVGASGDAAFGGLVTTDSGRGVSGATIPPAAEGQRGAVVDLRQ